MIENKTEQFPHLGKMPPEIKSIKGLNADLIDDDKLHILNKHLSSLEEQFPHSDKFVIEIRSMKGKITNILNGDSSISGIIMEEAMKEVA